MCPPSITSTSRVPSIRARRLPAASSSRDGSARRRSQSSGSAAIASRSARTGRRAACAPPPRKTASSRPGPTRAACRATRWGGELCIRIGRRLMAQQASTRYDPAEMERQYNPRADVPNHEEFHARNVARSEAYRAKAKDHAKFNIAYGPDAGETLDLFLPETKNAPVHVFIHGGYWRSRDTRDYAFLAEPFVTAGGLGRSEK